MASLEKARIFDTDTLDDILYVQFNPNTLEYSAGTSGQALKGVAGQDGSGALQEPHSQQSPIAVSRGASLSVKLFYHTYTSQDSFTDVRGEINRIRAYLPAPSAKGTSSSPRITFAWGTFALTGTLESFHVSFQMFAHDGTPVQAEVSISIRGEDPDVTAESTNQMLCAKSEELTAREAAAAGEDIFWLFEEQE